MKHRSFALTGMAKIDPLSGSVASAKPQDVVECLGEHALCNACKQVKGAQANCACYKVSEIHLVETKKILDKKAKFMTRKVCTTTHPCKVDRAPTCRAIPNGQYRVGMTTYPAVSTYSYRGWCQTFPIGGWHFEQGMFLVPIPGNDYVNRGACKPLRSD